MRCTQPCCQRYEAVFSQSGAYLAYVAMANMFAA